MKSGHAISTTNLTKTFGEIVAVDMLNLTVQVDRLNLTVVSFILGLIIPDLFGGFNWPLLALLFTTTFGYILLFLGIKKLSTLE